jgi:hypothetical protein
MGRPATLKVDIVSDARGVKKGTDDAESRLSKFSGKVGKFGKAAALGLVGVGVAAVVVGKQVVGAASEQQQAFGALDSIYGRNSKTVKRWAKSAATNLGLTATEYGNLSAIVGSQLKNMGRSQSAAAKDSDHLIHMGADLAATFGGSVSDAVEAVSSLLKGERDPIERYGVSIKQADINARLAALGQDKLKGSALATAQANATLYLLTKQTASAHGQFARETNTLAGQQERLKAQFGNVQATVGTALLPVLTRLFTFANSNLFPALKVGGAWLQSRLGPIFAQVGQVVTTRVVPALRSFGSYITGRVVPIIRSYLSPILAGLRSAWANIAAAVQRNRPQLIAVGTAMAAVGRAVGKLVIWLAEKLYPVLGRTIGLAFKALGLVIGQVVDDIGAFTSGVQSAVTWVQRLWDKLDGLAHKVGSIHLPDLNPFGAAGVYGMVPQLAGGSPSYAPGGPGLARASLSQLVGGGVMATGSARGGSVVVDRRDQRTYVTVDGALDAPAVARQLEQLLRDQAVRLGRTTAYGAAR